MATQVDLLVQDEGIEEPLTTTDVPELDRVVLAETGKLWSRSEVGGIIC